MGQKCKILQIQDLLNEVYPKGLIFKMTLFSPIDLDKIRPKNPKLWKWAAYLSAGYTEGNIRPIWGNFEGRWIFQVTLIKNGL